MDLVTIFPIAAGLLVLALLIAFEIMYRNNTVASPSARGSTSQGVGYKYYVNSNTVLQIRAMFGRKYRIYVLSGNCPVPLNQDRIGSYFSLTSRNTQELECMIDELFRVQS